jgi:amino acid adenylation domain-containing protein
MQVESFLEDSARRCPNKTALVCGKRKTTYAEIELSANRMAHGLIAQGIERGDRVAIHLDNSFEAVVALFAVLKAGAVFLFVNPTTKIDKLVYVLNNSRARGIFLPGRKLGMLEECSHRLPHLRTIVATGPVREPHFGLDKTCVEFDRLVADHSDHADPPAKRAIDVDLAALIYTSGSTGRPKGVMMTHLNMVSAATSVITYLENTSEDVILNVLPMAFGYGLYQVLMGFKVGGTVVLERSFAYPHAVMTQLVDEGVTGLPMVPTIWAMLLQMDLSKYDLSRMRYVTNAGAALPTDHIARFRKLLPHVSIYSMYGLTECKRVSYLPPEEIDARPSSVGRGMPNEEVYVVDDQGQRVGPGTVGELVVRGSHVMRGYWEMPEETERTLKPGPLPGEKVLFTGDLFRTDEEGYLYFVSRKDDMIISRGEKVSPKEVEDVLCGHPDVTEAAVVGTPDELLGEAVRAIVSLREGSCFCERDVLRHCAARLEDFMVPKSVHCRDALPKTENGKIDKLALKRELSQATT